jgi:hypothetical protein
MSHKDDELYLNCTDKEQIWLDEFAISGSIELATQTAYGTVDKDAARAYGRTVAARERIAKLIKDHIAPKVVRSLPTSEELRAMYIELYHLGQDVRTKLQALQSYERVSGFSKPKPNKDDGFDPLSDIQG